MPHPEFGKAVVVNLLDRAEVGNIHLENILAGLVIASQCIGYVFSVVGEPWIDALVISC